MGYYLYCPNCEKTKQINKEYISRVLMTKTKHNRYNVKRTLKCLRCLYPSCQLRLNGKVITKYYN